MSHSPSLRLLAPLCGALVLAYAPIAFAQEDAPAIAETPATSQAYPAPAPSPEAAGERFYQFLSAGLPLPNLATSFGSEQARPYLNAISRAQLEAIEASAYTGGRDEGALKLFILLAQQKDEPQYQGKVVGAEGEQTLVEVSPAPLKKRAVVVIAEDGGYRVDVKATYGRWNDLSGEKLDIAWADATGIVSPALAKNTAFLDKRARDSCQVNLKRAMLGILQYSQDYDVKFPLARKWVDDIFPYVQSQEVFRCPTLPAGANYGYAYNQNLSGLPQSKMSNIAQTVAIYETDDLTRNAFGAGEERAYRHLGGSNIAFADGHVKWYAQGDEPEDEVDFKP